MTDIPSWFVSWFNNGLGGGGDSQTNNAPADVSVSLVADKTSASRGDTITFTVTASNGGPAAMSGLTLGIPLGNSLRFVSSTPSVGTYDPASGTWTVGNVANAASATLSLVATVTGAGWTTITAQILAEGTPDPVGTNNVATASLSLIAPPPSGQTAHASTSTDGTTVSTAVSGAYNTMIVTAPVAGTAVTLANGYQAAYLSGNAAAKLLGNFDGHAVLAGNGGNDTIISVGGSDTIQAGSGNSLFLATNTALMSAAGQTGNNAFFGAAGAVTIQAGSGHDTAVLGAGGGVVTTGGGGSQVWAGSGDCVVSGVGAATVVASTGASTVNAVGNAGVLAFGGSGKMQFNGGSGVATVVGLAGSVTVSGGTGGGVFFGGALGNNVMASGTGQATLVGAGSGDVLSAQGSAADVLVASTGAETLNGANSSGNNSFFGGAGDDCIVGGSGNDAIVCGTGNMTLAGGGGTNLFVFNANVASTTILTDFDTSRDFVTLAGFGANAASNALANAVVANGSTTITLPDTTRITFQGITHLTRDSFT